MKLLTLILTIIPTLSNAAMWCERDTLKQIRNHHLTYDELIELSSSLCSTLSIADIRWALAIIKTESDFRLVISKDKRDHGLYQFNIGYINRRGLDRFAMTYDITAQTLEFSKVFKDKRELCLKRYPISYPACWNSSTPEHHGRYWIKLKRNYDSL